VVGLKFTFASGQSITQAWNATLTPASGAVTATNLSYNAAIPPGGNLTLGFNANHTSPTRRARVGGQASAAASRCDEATNARPS